MYGEVHLDNLYKNILQKKRKPKISENSRFDFIESLHDHGMKCYQLHAAQRQLLRPLNKIVRQKSSFTKRLKFTNFVLFVKYLRQII